MRKVLCLFIICLLHLSCTSEMEEDIDSIKSKGIQTFSISVEGVSSAKSTANKSAPILEPTFALVSIEGNGGELIFERKKLSLIKVNGNYVTEDISIDAGNYNLTEFIITDADNVVISIAPMTGSDLAQLSETTLPFGFTVEADKSKNTPTESVDAEGFTSFDFGYGSLNLAIPEATSFFTITIDESTLITTKSIVLKSLTGSRFIVDWGDGTVNTYKSTSYTSNEENELDHRYSEKKEYNVKIIGPLEAITTLKFYTNDQLNHYQSNITSVDLDQLKMLGVCYFYAGKLSTLNTSNNPRLFDLSLGNNELTSLDLSNNTKLRVLRVRYSKLTELDVSQSVDLDMLMARGNQISSLNLSNNPKLKILSAAENSLTELNISNNVELIRMDVSDNLLTNIDLSSNINLVDINFGRNKLSSIDISKNIALTRIDLWENQFTNMNISQNTKLKDIYVSGNSLSTLDLSKVLDLERLIIEDNNFDNLDITNNPKIFDFEIGKNQFSAAKIDELIGQIYEQTMLSSAKNGYIDFKNNPGSNNISPTTIERINELTNSHNWFFNNN